MTTVYLASPLGFSPEWKSYRDKIKQRLTELRCTVLDPWDQKFHAAIEEASTIQDWSARIAAFRDIARQIGKANEDMIRSSDVVLGVLDEPELDSGTASEIGFADCAPISGTVETLTVFPQICKCCTVSNRARENSSEKWKCCFLS